ncbi:MAG: LuxR C-terminal-related transcriptional regulator [Vicinamibacterales bacterium]
MPDPIRVFIAGSANERAILAACFAGDARWLVVSDAAMADLVVMSPDEWERLERPRSASPGRAAASLDRPGTGQPVEALTPREHEVLTLLAGGLHNREIAERMGVSEHTVKFHLGAIFGKLGASTRTEAVRKGLRMGVIEI